MRAGVPLAWLQLMKEKRRLLAALAGISFAVILMLMQLGFEDALFTSASLLQTRLHGELVLLNPQYEFLIHPKSFTERRLYQALEADGVDSVAGIYLGQAPFKNPDTHLERRIFLIGFQPRPDVFDISGLDAENLRRLREPDVVLFDAKSRPEFGPVPEGVERHGRVFTEVAGHRVEIAGLFRLGASFGSDGNLITSDLNFLRLFPPGRLGLVNLGLVQLQPGADPEKVRAGLAAILSPDVEVLTRQEFADLEKHYWGTETPVGFVFTLGLIMGLIVGCVIVYQILYTDVNDHLAEYATLKAMGYRDRYLFSVVLKEALVLSVLGFLPGLGIAQALYVFAGNATLLPMNMTLSRIVLVYLLTVVMCAIAGALAMRKLKSADPADIF